MIPILRNIQIFISRILGSAPFKVLAGGDTFGTQRFYAIQALDGEITFTATTSEGDDITVNRTLQQDANITGEFESITVDGASSGVAVIYLLEN